MGAVLPRYVPMSGGGAWVAVDERVEGGGGEVGGGGEQQQVRCAAVGGDQGGREGDREDVADVEDGVVERENPAAHIVRDVGLHRGVQAQLHHLAGRGQRECGGQHRRHEHRQAERDD